MSAVAGTTFGKSVDANTAQTVAYNYYNPKAPIQGLTDLALAYTATSVIGGVSVVDFYVFNVVSAQGFVIVSGDDNVKPILAYSTESGFLTTGINSSVQYLLDNYKKQIASVIQNNLIAPAYIANSWISLKTGNINARTARATSVIIPPLLPCDWDQLNEFGAIPSYNADCPYDSTASIGPAAQTVTGCVATAMSQVMKYWNWPDTGVGSHSYVQAPNEDNIPEQTANFVVPFHFDSMQTPHVVSTNAYVAQLMYFAGVSVNMHYGTTAEDGSGSYVTSAFSPIENCAEYALKTYFRYTALKGYPRYIFNETQWIDTMLNEMNSMRPVIYAGDGNAGGHCWVMDGYNSDTLFHFNFGWGGNYNGYFSVDDIDPNDSFNNDQEAIVRIIPDTPVHLVQTAVKTVQSSGNSINIFPDPATNEINISVEGIVVKEIMITDMQGREMQQSVPASTSKLITLSITDLPTGIYLMRLQTDDGIITRKFVVEK
jgi:hypothetical protein